MNRRDFITLAGTGTIEASALCSYPLLAAQGPLAAGWRRNIGTKGVLTPDFDPVPESEMWAMAPQSVSIHASRLPWTGGARAFAQPPQVDRAAEELARLAPRAILYAFTSSSYALHTQADDSLRVRLEKRAGGIPVLLTCPIATVALRTLDVHRVAVIHPPWFTEELNGQGMDYLRTQGFEVVLCARITPVRSFFAVLYSLQY